MDAAEPLKLLGLQEVHGNFENTTFGLHAIKMVATNSPDIRNRVKN